MGSDGRRISGALDATSFAVAYPVDRVGSVIIGDALPRYDSLLHGSVLGVPLDRSGAALPTADDAPDPGTLGVALGTDLDDVVAAFGAAALDEGDLDRRAAVEDVVAAFSAGLVSRLGTTDGLDDLGQREHENAFWALPGTPIAAARADRLRKEDTLGAGPMTLGRHGRGSKAAASGVRGAGGLRRVSKTSPTSRAGSCATTASRRA